MRFFLGQLSTPAFISLSLLSSLMPGNGDMMVTIFKHTRALAGVTQWIECWPRNQKVDGLIPCQGTCLDYGPGSQLGVCERQPIDISLTHQYFSLSPSLPLSLKINKIFKTHKNTVV